MPSVHCSVDGCGTRLQPVHKPAARDRTTWLYPECDVCFRPACPRHMTEVDGRFVCERCRPARPTQRLADLIALSLLRLDDQPD